MTQRIRPRRHLGFYDVAFWEHVGRRQLHLQRCDGCDHRWFPPGPGCPQCLSRAWSWQPVAGRGSLLTWAVFHRQYFAGLPAPYTIVAVELEEGPIVIADLLVSNGTGLPGGLRAGLPMTLGYETATDEDGSTFVIYHWALAGSDEG